MELSEFQKQITNDIIANKVVDIISFVYLNLEKVNPEITKERMLLDTTSKNRINELNKGLIYEIDNKPASFEKLKQYVGLISILKASNLILIEDKFDEFIVESDLFTKMPIILHYNFGSGSFEQPPEIHNLLWKYRTHYIIPLAELKTFSHNNFKTDQELNATNEENHRRKELRVTKVIAIISILLSIALAVINAMTYSRNRDVYIKEIPKTDSLHIIINEK